MSEQSVARLREVPIFEALPDAALHALAEGADEVTLKSGELLFRAGETAEGGHVVLAGRLELFTEQGARRKRLCELLPGALIGEKALLIAATRPCGARALEASRLLPIPRPVFLQVLQDFPEAAQALRALFAARIAETMGALDAFRAEKLDVPAPRRR